MQMKKYTTIIETEIDGKNEWDAANQAAYILRDCLMEGREIAFYVRVGAEKSSEVLVALPKCHDGIQKTERDYDDEI